jgi:hypothetical protein
MTQASGGLLDVLLLPLLIVCAVGGVAIIGWLVWAMTRSRKVAPIPAGAPVESTLASHPLPPQASELPYLVGLRRDEIGEWAICIGGKPYSTLEAVPNPETRDQVVAALRALADFARDYIRKTNAASTPVAPQPAVPQAASQSSERLPSATILDTAALRREAAPGATVPIIDLAKEIGDIVEEMVELSPTLRSRTIRLQNVPGEGVAFVVDGVRYHELDQIPDSEVQTLIRRATKEWERR